MDFPRAIPLVLAAFGVATPAFARKTNQAIYEDPFDLAAGGASLTLASKEGRVFANPALMPHGGKFHHWAGTTFTLLSNKESIDTAREVVQTSQSGGGESSSEEQTEEERAAAAEENQAFVDKVFQDPVRIGWGFALSWLTNNFGLAVFSRFEPDIRAREFGETGVPEVQFQAESYHGVVLGSAIRTPWRWLSFGLTAKHLLAAEPDIRVEATDQDQIKQFQDPKFIQDTTAHNRGTGVDGGMLIFLQGHWADFRLAGKVDDMGSTQLAGPGTLTEFKQVVSAGTGLTLHTGADAIHFAVDYRDILNSYEEESFKKIYAGTKILLRTYVGLAAGLYQGAPSYGAEIDLIFIRLAATTYKRELGDHPGVDPREMYMFSLSAGF